MPRFGSETETPPRTDINSAQVARFIRRMRLVGEGETRLLIAIEDEREPLSAPLSLARRSELRSQVG